MYIFMHIELEKQKNEMLKQTHKTKIARREQKKQEQFAFGPGTKNEK